MQQDEIDGSDLDDEKCPAKSQNVTKQNKVVFVDISVMYFYGQIKG